MEGPSGIVQQQDTLNRYLLYFTRGKSVLPDVHSFTGEEELSKPYRYTIRFTSPTSNIAVNEVLNQSAEFILRAPNPKAGWYDQEPWLPVRQINGVITSFSRLKSSADEALYECVLEHEAGAAGPKLPLGRVHGCNRTRARHSADEGKQSV